MSTCKIADEIKVDLLYDKIFIEFTKLIKSGDIEKFYSSMFHEVVFNATDFSTFEPDTVTIVLKKTVDKLVALKKESQCCLAKDNTNKHNVLSDKEQYGLNYIGGYVCHKLYKKYSNSSLWKEKNIQMAIAFIKATKIKCSEDNKGDACFEKINGRPMENIRTS